VVPPSGKKLTYINVPAKKHGASSAHTIGCVSRHKFEFVAVCSCSINGGKCAQFKYFDGNAANVEIKLKLNRKDGNSNFLAGNRTNIVDSMAVELQTFSALFV
jgi:hypothetical protein